jgi:hypothetical protein
MVDKLNPKINLKPTKVIQANNPNGTQALPVDVKVESGADKEKKMRNTASVTDVMNYKE